MGMAALDKSKQPSIDPETLARVAREVIARLSQASGGTSFAEAGQLHTSESKTNRTAASIDDRVITADTISRLPAGTAELFVPDAAVVTPSARDEARRSRYRDQLAEPNTRRQARATRHAQPEIIDFADPDRADSGYPAALPPRHRGLRSEDHPQRHSGT